MAFGKGATSQTIGTVMPTLMPLSVPPVEKESGRRQGAKKGRERLLLTTTEGDTLHCRAT